MPADRVHPGFAELADLQARHEPEAPKHVPSHRDPASVALLDLVVGVIEGTDPDTWWAGPTFSSPCGTRHCVLAHVFYLLGDQVLDTFENVWSTSYVIGAGVNDQASDEYPQLHPKDRVLAFLADLRAGRALDTDTSMSLHCLLDLEPANLAAV